MWDGNWASPGAAQVTVHLTERGPLSSTVMSVVLLLTDQGTAKNLEGERHQCICECVQTTVSQGLLNCSSFKCWQNFACLVVWIRYLF